MSVTCKSYPMCGTLQTCVLAKNRFYSEVDILLSQPSGTVCANDPTFTDLYGYTCADWNGDYNQDGFTDCSPEDSSGAAGWGYTNAEMASIRHACAPICNVAICNADR